MNLPTLTDVPADSGCFLRGDDGRCGVPFGTCPYNDERLALYYRPGGSCRPLTGVGR
jgi:hypothetical protein